MKLTEKKGPIAGEQEINVRGGSVEHQEEQLLDYLAFTKYPGDNRGQSRMALT